MLLLSRHPFLDRPHYTFTPESLPASSPTSSPAPLSAANLRRLDMAHGGPICTPSPDPVPWPHFPTLLPAASTSLQPVNMAAGRKRSRDETAMNDEEAYDSSDVSRESSSPHKPRPAGLRQDSQASITFNTTSFGPNGSATGTSSNGTFAEEVSERLRGSSISSLQRPHLDGPRKSARRDSDMPAYHDTAPTWHANHVSSSSFDTNSLPNEACRALGVGWGLIPSSEPMQAAVRGWSAFIEQRFPLMSVKFEWEKHSEPRAYLVCAVSRATRTPGYFLFQEDLQCGKMIAKSWERALDNLRAVPMQFDDSVEMYAVDPAEVAAEQRERERAASLAAANMPNHVDMGDTIMT